MNSKWTATVIKVSVAISLTMLIPGMYYYHPVAKLSSLNPFIYLTVIWILRCVPSYLLKYHFRKPFIKTQKIVGYIINYTSYFPLYEPTLLFGMMLFTLFRWGLACWSVATIIYLMIFLRTSQPKPLVLFLPFVCFSLTGMFCGWWHFNMVWAEAQGNSDTQSEVTQIISIKDLKRSGANIGECHPYTMDYDQETDTLIVALKDDWGSLFPRMDHKNHNILLACSTKGGDLNLRTVALGKSQVPEYVVLRPSEHRGWATILDFGNHSFYVASFTYSSDRIELLSLSELPIEPNGIFDDPARDRLLIVGAQLGLLELDPNTLESKNMTVFRSIPKSVILLDALTTKTPMPPLPWSLVIISALFDQHRNTIYFGTAGCYLHALGLDSGRNQEVSAFPLIGGLAYDQTRDEILATQPLQRRLLVLDPKTLAIKKKIDIETPVSRALALMPGTPLVLVGSYSQNFTLLVDRDRNQIIKRYRHLGRLQRCALTDPVDKRFFVGTGLGVFKLSGEVAD